MDLEPRNPKLLAFEMVEAARNRLLTVGPLVVRSYLDGETKIKPEWHPAYLEAEIALEEAKNHLDSITREQ